MEMKERKAVQKFVSKMVQRYSGGGDYTRTNNNSTQSFAENEILQSLAEVPETPFDINESIGGKYGDIADLLFSDDVREMIPIEPQDQLYRTVLKKTYGNSGISPHENIQGKYEYYLPLAYAQLLEST